ncbi:MAG: TIGR04222 domain-containing membrane protein [Clostridia bacterium]|nr:TIGR04222 domain-containing membrane protein [Clostridia bacterium]
MLDLLISIPGPQFLGYFILLAIASLVTIKIWLLNDGTKRYPMPGSTELDPISLSALRGGSKAVLTTVLYDLWRRNLIQMDGNGTKTTLWIGNTSNIYLTPIEKEITFLLTSRKKLHELYKNKQLLEKIESLLKPVYNKLIRLHLMRPKVQDTRSIKAILAVLAILFGFGGTKLLLGISRHKPSGFLFLLLIASAVTCILLLNNRSYITTLGRKYLRSLTRQFNWMRNPQAASQTDPSFDPLFGFSLFGIMMLSGESNKPFHDALKSSGYTSSGSFDGGYDGGSSGCSGGGGCGGGGCGGGGCGGGGCGGCGS